MTIEFGNSDFTFANRAYVAGRERGDRSTRATYYFEWLCAIGLPAFCAFVAFRYGNAPIIHISGLILSIQAFRRICVFRTFDTKLFENCHHSHLSAEQKRIHLEIADDGIREHQGGIVSFAPWKDVTGTMIEGDLLVISLSSGQEAIIPRVSPGIAEVDLKEVRGEIERRRTKT